MKLEKDDYRTMLTDHLTNRLGWTIDEADMVSGIAVDVLCQTHGGTQIYVPKRVINEKEIHDDYGQGTSISKLCRKYGLTAVKIRNILKKTYNV